MSIERLSVPLLILLAVASTAVPEASLLAQDAPTRVEVIRVDPPAHADRTRTVVGVVDRLVDRGPDQRTSFYLEDDYGHQILIVPTGAVPARGERVTVTGTVVLDATGDPYITMFAADGTPPVPPPATDPDGPGGQVEADTAGAPAAGPVDPLPPSGPVGFGAGNDFPFALFLGIAGGVIGLLVVSGYLVRRGRVGPPLPAYADTDEDDEPEVGLPISELWQADDGSHEFDGRTMKFSRPDPTLQLLPGRLEVTGGEDAGQVIRFVMIQGDNVEMSFGRAKGLGPQHIQLKEQTVSRRHAVLRRRDGDWWLQNLSQTNPTVLNDQVLGGQEVPLSDDDQIEMGEVTFRFKAS